MKKKKLLFIIWSFSYGGGAERILSNIVNNLDPNKYEIEILEYFYIGIKKEKINDNIKLLPPIIDGTNRKLSNRIKNAIIHFLISRYPALIRRRYLNKTYDVEIAFNYMIPTFLLNEKSDKLISWMHGAIYDLKENKKNRKIQDKYLKKVNNIVSISNKTYESVVDVFPQYKNKMLIINNGFEFKDIQTKSMEKTNSKKVFDLIFCGRLDDNKNPLKMLKILKKTKEKGYNFKLAYIGTGNIEKELREKIKEYEFDKNVSVLGYQNNPYVYMKDAKLICMTSYREGFPTVIAEAMTLGKPFISTNVAGAEELSNKNKCGFIEDDIEKYSDKVIELLTNKELYKTMSNECKKHVKKYSMEEQIKKIEALINKE